jgi:hypothetical protein
MELEFGTVEAQAVFKVCRRAMRKMVVVGHTTNTLLIGQDRHLTVFTDVREGVWHL